MGINSTIKGGLKKKKKQENDLIKLIFDWVKKKKIHVQNRTKKIDLQETSPSYII